VILPILFLIFNRPDTTARVFEAIRQAQPPRLYIAADGPRVGYSGEAEQCANARRVAAAVDWPCEVRTLFRDKNLGCREAVSGGINWFFEHEPEGIILEDDCLPHPTFFTYCAELLARYREDERVMVISGDNTIPASFPTTHSYCFSRFPLIWGWASWSMAWRRYDFEAFKQADRHTIIRRVEASRWFTSHWETVYQKVATGEIDTWDYVWNYSVWANDGLATIPSVNLILNIGFGESATHTKSPECPRARVPVKALEFPLVHPPVQVIPKYEQEVMRHIHDLAPPPSPTTRVARRLHVPSFLDER
jgi:hypothetical protein